MSDTQVFYPRETTCKGNKQNIVMQILPAHPTGVRGVRGGAFLYRRYYATPTYYYVQPATQVKSRLIIHCKCVNKFACHKKRAE